MTKSTNIKSTTKTTHATTGGKSFPRLVPPALDGPSSLYFSAGNAKLKDGRTALFSLPAGHTCPGACECLSWFDRGDSKLRDGAKTEFRCFAASLEAAFDTKRKSVDRNYAILLAAKTTEKMAMVIDMSLPAKRLDIIRVHEGGDFFSQNYFLAWMEVARRNPDRLFYAYTKSLPIWIKSRSLVPANFVLTASRGGKWDSLIEPNGLRSAVVVYHPEEAEALGLEIDHDDSHARANDGKSFALLIHGAGPAGSKHNAAIKRLKQENVQFSYSK